LGVISEDGMSAGFLISICSMHPASILIPALAGVRPVYSTN
jgi:hypothetical protein